MKHLTRKEAMESPEVHNLTKDVLKMTEDKDPVDRFFDMCLALQVVQDEMNEACGLPEGG